MLEALGIAALTLAVLSTIFLVALVLRRTSIAREERRRLQAERRLRSLALDIVGGEEIDVSGLATEELAILAEVIGRLSRNLSGDARRRISAYFAGTSAFATELRSLGDRRAWRRATAAYRLGDMACDDAVPRLIRSLNDRDADVRSATARSLGRLQAHEATEPLLLSLVVGVVPRAIAFRAILDIGATALPGLHRLARSSDAAVRAGAIELIGWLGDASDAELLVGAMNDSAAEVRARAAGALGRLAEDEGATALTDALDDRIYFVRLHAARALGQVGEREAVPRLLQQAREDRFEAARAAAEAISRIDPEALLAAAELPDAGPHLHEAADLLKA